MPKLPGFTDPGDVNDGDIGDPTWADNVRADLNAIDGILGKKFVKQSETTQIDVVNTTTETALMTYTVPANLLGSSGIVLKVLVVGTITNNSGGAIAVTFRFKYGSTTIVTDAFGPSDGDDYPVRWELELFGLGATNSQQGVYWRQHSSNDKGDYGAAAEDSTGDLDLVLTAQWASANAAASVKADFSIVELIQE